MVWAAVIVGMSAEIGVGEIVADGTLSFATWGGCLVAHQLKEALFDYSLMILDP